MDMVQENATSNSSNGGDKEAAVTTVPLSKAVSYCARRWYIDTLKEATAGDVSMQVLVSQMYYNGYGVTRNADMAAAWMERASRVRSSAWKVGNKRPGYEASAYDSDSSSN